MLMNLFLMHDVLVFVYRSHEQRLSVDGMVVQNEGQQEVNAMLAELPPLAVDSMSQVMILNLSIFAHFCHESIPVIVYSVDFYLRVHDL